MPAGSSSGAAAAPTRRPREAPRDATDGLAAISLRDVSLWYGRFPALERISFDVPKGEFVSIVGPTGSGKSTILNMVAGLLAPTAGLVQTEGQAVSGINRRCGYMFQSDSLLPWRTAIDNVMLGPILRGVPRRRARAEAADWLARVGLRGFESRYPHHLSGGQRKRVAMAQVLINEPEILLMDEPFGALDAQTRTLMGDELLGLWSELGSTVLFVTHDLEEAVALSDRVLLVTSGPQATIRGDYRVALERPRQVTDARFLPGFDAVYERVWRDLKEEVMFTYERSR
jgi:NitT/TauT family transport system ATP-binding protein